MDRARVAVLAERLAPIVAALAIVWPMAAYRYAASFDLPFHEEVVAAMRFHGDASHYPPDFFVWNVGLPNQLFYFLAYPLAFVVSVHVACTIVLAAAVVAIPIAAARVADHLGKTRWVALAVAPIAIGFPFNTGFVGNVLGIALLLAFLPRFDRFASRPTAAGAALAIGALLVLDLAHESAMAFGALAIGVLAIGYRVRVRETALRALPPLMAVAAIAFVHVYDHAMKGPTLNALPNVIDIATSQKNDALPRMLLGQYNPDRMGPATYAFTATLALFAFDAWRTRDRARSVPATWAAQIAPYRFAILGAALVAGYYLAPWSVTGVTWVNQRFLSPGVAVFTIAIAPRAKPGPSWVTRAASTAAVVSAVMLALPGFATTSASLRDLDALIPLVAKESAVGHVEIVGASPRTYVFSIGGAVTRVVAANGGRTPSSFLHDATLPPILIAPKYRWNGLEMRDAMGGLALRPAYDLRELRYVIVWALSADVSDAAITAALAPDARFVARSGGWILYESTHDLASIASTELAVPAAAESIGDRLKALAAAQR